MQKLKVLFVSHSILGNDSGVARVHHELKSEYEKAGYEVDKVDLADLFPNGRNFFQKIFGPAFTLKVFEYLKKNAYKYDIIDTNFTNIIYAKASFGFKGLLFVRSHGIPPLYDKAAESEAFGKSLAAEIEKRTLKNKIGAFIKSFYKDFKPNDFYASVKHADIIHCLNKSEYDFFIDLGIEKDRIVLIPNGLPKKYIDSFESVNTNRASAPYIVGFIGAWHYIKGIQYWREI